MEYVSPELGYALTDPYLSQPTPVGTSIHLLLAREQLMQARPYGAGVPLDLESMPDADESHFG